jgi:hypothetical protein
MPRTPLAARGPGVWLALKPEEAFGSARAAWLRRIAFFGLGPTAVAILLPLSRQLSPEAPYLAVLDALALVPLLATGRAAQLPPHRARDAAPLLARVHAALRREPLLRVAPWARFTAGATEADELRLFVLPRAALPGLLGIELGVAWAHAATAWAPRFEAVIRVHEATDAQARLALVAPFARAVTGRRPEERVFVLAPRLPGTGAARALVARLSQELTDRRMTVAAPLRGGPANGYEGPERRAQDANGANAKTDKVPAAA